MTYAASSVSRVLPERLTFKQWLCRALPPILSYRLAKRVFLRTPPPAGDTFVTTTITGGLYSFRSGDGLADQVRMCGYWDWKAQAIAMHFCKPGDTILEVGANTGTETVGFAQIVGSEGAVVAFEPFPQLADAIRNNARMNGFEHVETVQAAVSDFIGTVHIHPASAINSGQGYISSADDRSAVSVPAITLDSMIGRLRAANLMLIDVEGHEPAVLRGAEEYIRRYHPVLIVEAIADQLERAGSTLAELANQIVTMGYTVYQVNRFSVTEANVATATHHNWLCIPNDRTGEQTRVSRFIVLCALMPRFLQPLRLTRRREFRIRRAQAVTP